MLCGLFGTAQLSQLLLGRRMERNPTAHTLDVLLDATVGERPRFCLLGHAAIGGAQKMSRMQVMMHVVHEGCEGYPAVSPPVQLLHEALPTIWVGAVPVTNGKRRAVNQSWQHARRKEGDLRVTSENEPFSVGSM